MRANSLTFSSAFSRTAPKLDRNQIPSQVVCSTVVLLEPEPTTWLLKSIFLTPVSHTRLMG